MDPRFALIAVVPATGTRGEGSPYPELAPSASGLEKTSFAILSGATGGVAQFYDRDAVKELADEGMKGMQEFISKPERLDAILAKLEKDRQRIHKAK